MDSLSIFHLHILLYPSCKCAGQAFSVYVTGVKSMSRLFYSHTNVFKYEHIAYALILILIIGEYYGTL